MCICCCFCNGCSAIVVINIIIVIIIIIVIVGIILYYIALLILKDKHVERLIFLSLWCFSVLSIVSFLETLFPLVRMPDFPAC